MLHPAQRLRRVLAVARTIRVRLTLWYVALLALILLAFSAFLYLSLEQSLTAELDRSLDTQAQQAASTLDVQDGQPELESGQNGDGPVAGAVVALYDSTGGRLLALNVRGPLPAVAQALAQAGTQAASYQTIEFGAGDPWRVHTLPVIEGGRRVAVLQIARPERDIQAALRQLLLLIGIAVPFTLLLAVAGGLFLAARALDPIDRVTRAAAQIGAEDLSRRLAFRGADDEVGRLANTFDAMLDRLERAFRRQRQFTADASHELRTPLAILTSQADVALERPRKSDEYRRVISAMREDARRMGQLVSELLTLARADAGQEVLAREPLDLADLVGEVVTAMGALATAREVRLERGPLSPLVIQGDQTRLTQLLVNLVDNAIKYTPAGGHVSVSVEQVGEAAEVRVADTGVGIPPEHLPHLFERFYRVDTARARAEGGTGLGLAISRWVAQAHGGDIAVESQPGRGTTFTVRLPAAHRGQTGPAGASTAAPAAPTVAAGVGAPVHL